MLHYLKGFMLCNCSEKPAAPERMPQTSKVNSSAAGGPGQVSAPDHGEPPPPQAEPRDLAAGDGGVGGDEDQGDLQINKSPSDPKKYR